MLPEKLIIRVIVTLLFYYQKRSSLFLSSDKNGFTELRKEVVVFSRIFNS